MNVLVASEGTQVGILAVMTGVLPVPVAKTAPLGTGFLNLVNVLIKADSLTKIPDAPVIPKVDDASPKQIAEALIRSMLGGSQTTALPKSHFTDSNADTNETQQQKQERDQRAPSVERVPIPPVALALVALAAQTPAPSLQAAAPAAPKEAASAAAPLVQSRVQNQVAAQPAGSAAQPAGVAAEPAPAQVAPRFELAFGAVLTRLETERALAPAQPKSPAASGLPQPAPPSPERIVPDSSPLAKAPQVTDSQVTPPPVTLGKQLPQTQVAPQQPPSQPALAEGKTEEKTKPASRDRETANARITAAAAAANSTSDHGPDFARVVNTSLGARAETRPPQEIAAPHGAAAVETPGRTVAEAIRGSEPVQPVTPPQARGSSAQEFAVRIAPPNAPAVDLHVSERNGQVQIAVRTPDTGLQTSLRQDLGTLVNSLQRAGYHTDTFAPHGAVVQASSPSGANPEGDRPGDHRGPHNGSSGRGSGESSGGRQQQQHHQPGQDSQDWIEEWETQA